MNTNQILYAILGFYKYTHIDSKITVSKKFNDNYYTATNFTTKLESCIPIIWNRVWKEASWCCRVRRG